jgi:hypothetical protein
MVAALDRQRQRLVPLRRVVGTTTREREREKGEREKRGREIGALFFFSHLP